MRRIFICGPAGTGKTTLAHILSKEHEMGKFISGSSKVLWEKHGIKCHRDIIIRTANDPDWGHNFQLELLELRENLLEYNSEMNIITDRSPADNLIHYTLQNTPYETAENSEAYYIRAFEIFKPGDWLIYRYIQLETRSKIISEDDGKRIINPFYQYAYQLLLQQEFVNLERLGVNVISLPYNNVGVDIQAINTLAKHIKLYT